MITWSVLGVLCLAGLVALSVAASDAGPRPRTTTAVTRAAPVFAREAAAVSSRCPDAYAIGRSLQVTVDPRACGAALRELLDLLGLTTGEIERVLSGPALVAHSDLSVQSSTTTAGQLLIDVHRRLS